MMEALRYSETSVLTRATRRNIPEDGILHRHRRENLKSYWESLVTSYENFLFLCTSLNSFKRVALLFGDSALFLNCKEIVIAYL
jgi:hypothetical protein